jgi:dTDP-4-dehydrorhamnose reductase
MVKYAVLGAVGQLGRDLCPRLAGEVATLTRDRADLTRPDTLRSSLKEIRPDVVVNCAAYNFVDQAESEPEAAFAVNAWGVRQLALVCRDLGCLLVHFSTDYVFGFDDTRRTPYREDDAPGPVGVYGLSKLAGEYLVQSLCPQHLLIRTCGLYGVHGSGGKGTNFVEAMLRQAEQGRTPRVVADQVLTPSYTVDVATAVVALLRTGQGGVYHVTNADSCSWHEFATAIFERAGLKVDVMPITSAARGAPARRPAYSVLSTAKYRQLGLPPLRPWHEALAAYLQERTKAVAPGDAGGVVGVRGG